VSAGACVKSVLDSKDGLEPAAGNSNPAGGKAEALAKVRAARVQAAVNSGPAAAVWAVGKAGAGLCSHLPESA
jgi:hypothetical protein